MVRPLPGLAVAMAPDESSRVRWIYSQCVAEQTQYLRRIFVQLRVVSLSKESSKNPDLVVTWVVQASDMAGRAARLCCHTSTISELLLHECSVRASLEILHILFPQLESLRVLRNNPKIGTAFEQE